MELTAYSPRGNFAISGGSHQLQIQAGRDISLGVSRDSRLLDDVTRACERLLRQLMRAGLQDDIRNEVEAQIGRVLDDTRRAREDLRGGTVVDVTRHVLSASGYFGRLAVQLGDHGIRDEPITRRLEDEARVLIRSAGGAVGGGGGSDSSP